MTDRAYRDVELDRFACRSHDHYPSISCEHCRRLGDSAEDAQRLAIIAAARALVGQPFSHRSRAAPGVAAPVDCSGLFVSSSRTAGLIGMGSKDFEGYRAGFEGDEFLAAWRSRMFEIPVEEARPADALILWIYGTPCHALMLAESGSVIHAEARSKRGVIEHRLTLEWMPRIRAAFTYRSDDGKGKRWA